MNEYSYKDANQEAFSAWFKAIPAEEKSRLVDNIDDGFWLKQALADAGQGAGWYDALIDNLLEWRDANHPEPSGISNFDAVGIAEGWIAAESEKQFYAAWQQLIDTGLCWQLQGWFGRTAEALIEEGVCQPARRAA